jgi:hypothetical protein
MSTFTNTVSKCHNEAKKLDCSHIGYYLVHSSGRHFISDKVSEYALNNVCNKVLTDTDYDYWVDYSLGRDVDGKVCWGNMDYTDKFI